MFSCVEGSKKTARSSTLAVMDADPKTVSLLVDQMADAGDVSAKPMFKEYGVYYDGRIAARSVTTGCSSRPPLRGGRSRPEWRRRRPIPAPNPVCSSIPTTVPGHVEKARGR